MKGIYRRKRNDVERFISLSLIALVLSAVPLMVGCGDARKTSIQTGKSLLGTFDAGRTIIIPELLRGGNITPEQANFALSLIEKGHRVTTEFVDFLESHPKLKPENRDELFKLADDILSVIEQLNDDSEHLLTNEAARARVRQIVIAAKMALLGVRTLLDTNLIARIDSLPSIRNANDAREVQVILEFGN